MNSVSKILAFTKTQMILLEMDERGAYNAIVRFQTEDGKEIVA